MYSKKNVINSARPCAKNKLQIHFLNFYAGVNDEIQRRTKLYINIGLFFQSEYYIYNHFV